MRLTAALDPTLPTDQSLWDSLVVHNPMLIEITRFRRRFLSFSSVNGINSAMLALLLVAYCGLNLIVLTSRGSIPPIPIVILQTVLYCFAAPAMLHSSIAGEREKRTWDVLLTAPISKAQIVVGKFIGALAALGIATLLFLVPVMFAALTYNTWSSYSSIGAPSMRGTDWSNLLLSELVSCSFAVMVCALSLFLSARVKRGLMALGASLGGLAVFLIGLPGLIAAVLQSDGITVDLLMFLHPFWTLSKLLSYSQFGSAGRPNEYIDSWLIGIPQTLTYLFLAVVFVGWTVNTLNFPENEVKFIPKAKNNA